ncbi:MoaD/ThiS family protein [Sphingosinicella rhizophila]|uniref:MoaD/ThiS family protein n=1 Tax=Sphingosinicella rhizophila TaxID=3050082 RepID=A0ABU3Q5V7_9SPHN|nr:MoaD/ThiS family protein [Sphingosinicella sp. GR2756]MDT9598781.1 MoaD/ThiS family protein [Sphingosinicella sp. GR2756]
MGNMTVRFYGRLAEACGPTAEIPLEAQSCTIAELRNIIGQRFPDMATDLTGPSVRAAVADVMVPDDRSVSPGTEVEFFPIVSGG